MESKGNISSNKRFRKISLYIFVIVILLFGCGLVWKFWGNDNNSVLQQTTELIQKVSTDEKEVSSLVEVDIDTFDEIIIEGPESIFVKQKEKWGVLNNKNQQLVECKYDYIAYAWDDNSTYSPNYIVVQNDKFGKITETGNEIFPCLYDGITTWVEYGPNGHYVMIGDKMGLIDYNGKILIPIQFEKVRCLDETTWALVYNKGKMGLYNIKYKSFFLPIEYDFIAIDYNWYNLYKDKPLRVITYKDGIVNIFDKTGKIIQTKVPKTEIKKRFEIDIDAYQYSPCSYELELMKHNKTYKAPDCLLETLKSYKEKGYPIESIYYSMDENKLEQKTKLE